MDHRGFVVFRLGVNPTLGMGMPASSVPRGADGMLMYFLRDLLTVLC